MVSWLQKLEAKLVLAGLFFVHLIKRVLFFWKKKPGLNEFLQNFRGDNITPVGAEERKLFPEFQRCQVCSLCTFSCEAIAAGRAPAGFEPKFVLLGFGRSAHESEYFFDEWLPCLECASCTVECPTHVPVHAMVATVVERRKHVAYRK
ncbi:MAG: hypothetical protein H6617_08200 [Bdellovibrionaceae bacterium]|nr:hypothetical protein [Bdellovibrionales bacterium]MCB9254647.1 hypothetical protein [Pseudobdellovibrionaceae bacterium]